MNPNPTPDPRPFGVRSRRIPRLVSGQRTSRYGVLTAMVVWAAAFFVAPTAATATPISYTLSGVTLTGFSSPTISLPGTIVLTGSFTFDPSEVPSPLNTADITATGPTSILVTSPEVFTVYSLEDTTDDSIGVCVLNCGTGDEVLLVFENPLSDAPDPINRAGFSSPTLGLLFVDTATGSALPTTTAAPEPASLTLLGGALALFLFARRGNRRGRRA
jgi:hypothetical protein